MVSRVPRSSRDWASCILGFRVFPPPAALSSVTQQDSLKDNAFRYQRGP